MSEANQAGASLAPEKVATLLASALRARKNGNIPAARALLRVLAADQPAMPQIWMALATVAETRAEQRHALERVAALDPTNPLAQRGLARMAGTAPAPAEATPAPQPLHAAPAARAVESPATPAHNTLSSADRETAPSASAPEEGVGAAPALMPTVASDQAAARTIRWPLYMVIAISVAIVLIAFFFIRGTGVDTVTVAPTSALPGAAPLPPATTAELPAAATAELARPAEATTSLPSPTPNPTARPTAAPTATPLPTLEVGAVIKQGVWHAVLLRPDDAIVLDGSIGDLQPRGRFVLALIAVGNDGSAPAQLPADLFVLVDRAGERYAPLPTASTAYLNVYGRGQRGDLSLEDQIPADGGNKSVPLIFDVPANTGDLYLVVKGNTAGWPIRQ